jgi:hypothetical protein
VDILITKNGFQTLVDVAIANSTHTNLVQHVLIVTVHATIVVVQDKA